MLSLILPLIVAAQVPPDRILHLRADSGIEFDAEGRIAAWRDLSPRHSDFVTPPLDKPSLLQLTRYHDTASKRVYTTLDSRTQLRPRLTRNGIGGRPAVVFDGAQALCDTTSLPLDSGFTLFVVAQDSTGNGWSATLLDKGVGDMNTALNNGWADSINGCFSIGVPWVDDIAQSNFETDTATIYESSWDGRSADLRVNGRFLASGKWTGSISRNKSTWIGAVVNPYDDLQNFMKGRIAEILVFRGKLDSSTRSQQLSELKCRYGIDTSDCEKTAPGLILHLRADTGLVLDASGRVSIWKDLSPRHSDFVTPNLDKPELLFLTPYVDDRARRRFVTLDSAAQLRPHLEKKCTLGKLACVRFDGANTLTDTTNLPLDSGFTMFIVAQDSSEKGAFTALVDKGPGDINTDLWTGVDGNFQMGIGWIDNIAQSQLETTAPTVYASSFDGTRGNIWANGRLEGTGTTTAKPVRNKNTWLGATYNQYPVLMGFLTGRIYEVRIYYGVLDSNERKAIEHELISSHAISMDSSTSGQERSKTTKMLHRFTRQGSLEITGIDEGLATLIGLDGRIIASARIHDGVAHLPRFHGSAFLAIRSTGFASTQRILSP